MGQKVTIGQKCTIDQNVNIGQISKIYFNAIDLKLEEDLHIRSLNSNTYYFEVTTDQKANIGKKVNMGQIC